MEQVATYENRALRARPFLSSDSIVGGTAFKGRGATSNISGRFEKHKRTAFDDGWDDHVLDWTSVSNDDVPPLKTTVAEEKPKHIITRNSSPDVPFDRSINPYRGCEHGCVYCFARPTHAFMGLSPGLDFESKLFAKPNAAALLREELAKKAYKVSPIAMGTNTDPYQPIEKTRRITRSILEVLDNANHPVSIVTKSRLILRDIDILKSMAERGLVKVGISVTTLDHKLSMKMEPRATSPQRRLDVIRLLKDAGVPVSVMVAPIIPGLTDVEIEQILKAARHAGAEGAAYIMMRLPLEVAPLFADWLAAHFPDRKNKILARVRAVRGGKLSDSQFKRRMRGEGLEADLLNHRFKNAHRRYGFSSDKTKLDCRQFVPPISVHEKQMSLAL